MLHQATSEGAGRNQLLASAGSDEFPGDPVGDHVGSPSHGAEAQKSAIALLPAVEAVLRALTAFEKILGECQLTPEGVEVVRRAFVGDQAGTGPAEEHTGDQERQAEGHEVTPVPQRPHGVTGLVGEAAIRGAIDAAVQGLVPLGCSFETLLSLVGAVFPDLVPRDRWDIVERAIRSVVDAQLERLGVPQGAASSSTTDVSVFDETPGTVQGASAAVQALEGAVRSLEGPSRSPGTQGTGDSEDEGQTDIEEASQLQRVRDRLWERLQEVAGEFQREHRTGSAVGGIMGLVASLLPMGPSCTARSALPVPRGVPACT